MNRNPRLPKVAIGAALLLALFLTVSLPVVARDKTETLEATAFGPGTAVLIL